MASILTWIFVFYIILQIYPFKMSYIQIAFNSVFIFIIAVIIIDFKVTNDQDFLLIFSTVLNIVFTGALINKARKSKIDMNEPVYLLSLRKHD